MQAISACMGFFLAGEIPLVGPFEKTDTGGLDGVDPSGE